MGKGRPPKVTGSAETTLRVLRYSQVISRYTGSSRMRFSVDAHAIGCRLTGNEVYIRNLLNEFARLDPVSEFVAYLSKPAAELDLSSRLGTRYVSANPFRRLGLDIPARLREDRPDVLHVQYTGPLF